MRMHLLTNATSRNGAAVFAFSIAGLVLSLGFALAQPQILALALMQGF